MKLKLALINPLIGYDDWWRYQLAHATSMYVLDRKLIFYDVSEAKKWYHHLIVLGTFSVESLISCQIYNVKDRKVSSFSHNFDQ